jgi:hypothetical protein
MEGGVSLNQNLPIIVGESNPYGADPHYALYPDPPGCAGERLCHRVMGLRRGTYLSSFERVNLVQGPKWNAPVARTAAANIAADCSKTRTIVLLGRKVASAFGYAGWKGIVWRPGTAYAPDLKFVVIPHPSGRNKVWNDRGVVASWRGVLLAALPDVPFGEADQLPTPEELFGPPLPQPSGMHFEVQFECVYCKSEPDYRGTCSCSHAPCVHQVDVNRRSK